VTVLRRVARNVADLVRMQEFYAEGLGFTPLAPAAEDPELAEVLGVARVKTMRMGLGAQVLELTACYPAGQGYPENARANDLFFQHIAIVTTDVLAAQARAMAAGATMISHDGPQKLPPRSGGVTAWKFRDPEGHPLEFLQLAACGEAFTPGFDHSAISVAEVVRSIAFYESQGLVLRQRQGNYGAEQDRLDGLENVSVEVVALAAGEAPPHVELLCYAAPAPRPAAMAGPADIAADRLVFGNAPGQLALLRDPDGHCILLDGRA
jgi:catechol 2,3-dioxygenase-like lactoylglutathione lyase family enzyme